jgi:hypothetical protein
VSSQQVSDWLAKVDAIGAPEVAVSSTLEDLWTRKGTIAAQLDALEPLFAGVQQEVTKASRCKGCVSDVRMRVRNDQEKSAKDSSERTQDHPAAADPFQNFHVDVPVLSSFFLWSFATRFGSLALPASCFTQAEEILARAPKPAAVPSPLTLADLLEHKSIRSYCDTDGFVYQTQLCCRELLNKLYKEEDSAESLLNSDSDDSSSCSECQDEDRTVGGQINIWWQLNENETCAQPTLGFIPRDATMQVFDALQTQQDYFSDMACENLTAQVQEIFQQSPIRDCQDLKRGQGLVWDAKSVLHSAIYVDQPENPARRSLEVRFTTLNDAEIEAYTRAIVQELHKCIVHAKLEQTA